ncbi:ATP phosphoribosyltransferase regulatory subunit [Alphaproteobacteria bacterium]|jgi:ATP phosphoribosyltransferase regulatory subunit|nr:ATP phosphoribosyltransferase regulatory subunit [Alphaproteobacteria bacterium]MBT5799575.1 ATP phosphoribosyltransferase regulatory subunit [Alphaproteobacteria bacterium]MDC0462332.1 ATP phosphoribosyltransferase regulatory subunit [Alphaproteobacteria bacterium]
MAISEDDNDNQGLLPAGLMDLLDPVATQNSRAISTLLDTFAQFGYRRVKPPLVEFEATLLAKGPGAATAAKSFRVMDPLTQNMMALRSDMTAQIARISGTRLAHKPRPLRIAYEGDVMRVLPDTLNSERQLFQVGAELIGFNDATATAEILILGVKALNNVGITSLTIDLGAPLLADSLMQNLSPSNKKSASNAIHEKDIDALQAIKDDNVKLIIDIINASGTTKQALAGLIGQMPDNAAKMMQDMLFVAEQLHEAYPDLPVTLDPLERQGFDYHTGVGFSIFASGLRGEIARGGAYLTDFSEPATGLSVYMERVLRGLPDLSPPKWIYMPSNIPKQTVLSYIDRGRCVIQGRYKGSDKMALIEARQLKCAFIVRNSDSTPESLEE